MLRKALLLCGIVSSLLYVGIDQIAALRYGGYHSFASQTISELMARGAPTKALVDPLFLLYSGFVTAFGVGVWRSARDNRALRITAGLLIVYALVGLPGPSLFAMNVRGSTNTSGDLAHIVLTGVVVALILAAVAFGAFALGRRFRVYSFVTIALMLVFGALVGTEAKGIATGAPTSTIGLYERANIGAFLLWVAVLALALLRRAESAATHPAAAGATATAQPAGA